MWFSGLSWKLFLGTGLLLLIATGTSLAWLAHRAAVEFEEAHIRHLDALTLAIAAVFERSDATLRLQQAPGLSAALAADGVRIAVVENSGQTIGGKSASGAADERELEIARRPELEVARREGSASLIAHVDGTMHHVRALRLGTLDSPRGVLWLAQRCSGGFVGLLARRDVAIVVVLIVAAALSANAIALSRLWAIPLRNIIDTARNLSRGDLSARAGTQGDDELALLARSLNRMRDRLVAHVETIDGQRRVLESLLTQLHEGVVVAGSDGRIALLNPAAVRLLDLPGQQPGSFVGVAIERCIPQHDLQRMLLTPIEPAAELGAVESAQTNGAGRSAVGGDVWEDRVQIESSEGLRHLLAHASDILLPTQREVGTSPSTGRLLVLTDITTLSRALQIKTDFVGNASHELRTPLSTIRAAIETLLQLDLQSDGVAARRFIEVIDRQSGRLEALARDLLELARLESTSSKFEPEQVLLAEILGELRSAFLERMQSKGLVLELFPEAAGKSALLAHPHLLRLVLDNLVDNAVKFTDAGGTVRVACRSGPGWFAFEVADSGCGIPPDEQERVFERFYQVERARSGRERGTGLGLSIVRHAVAAMDGRVELSSVVGEGTRVVVTLPQPPIVSPQAKAS